MFRRKKEPKAGEDLSKVTKVILKDLKGVRVTNHKFHNDDKSEIKEEEKKSEQPKRVFTPCNLGIAGGIILALLVSTSVWKEIFTGKTVRSKKEEITQTQYPEIKQITPIDYPKKKSQQHAKKLCQKRKAYLPKK